MVRSVLIDRRAFIGAAGAAFVSALAPRGALALQRADAVYAAAFKAPDGRYGLALVAEDGTIIARIDLPDRAHGLCHSTATGRTVAFARRPGTFAAILDPVTGLTVIAAPEGRHFFGHGQFSPDGRILYASENDFDNNRGVIGLYDAGDHFRRIGEYSAFGIGTHDMTVSDDGRLLVIANGGIATHPDFGRTKLNLGQMDPSLVLVDAGTGDLVEKHAMPAGLEKLSTRHVDLGADGRIWFAGQYEGARNDLPPLIGSFRRGEPVKFLDLPETVTTGLANYVGAIAVNRRENLVGVTSPRGGYEAVVDAVSGQVVSTRRIADAAGIAAAATGFAVSSYRGGFAGTSSPVAWDQHITRLVL